nr:D-alanine--D-alanine ligase [uncultured bacterium]
MSGDRSKKIGVLMGGLSREREVSLRSGQAVLEALQRLGYAVVGIDVDATVAKALEREKIEVAFLALHGRYGEDGCIQGLLEILSIPYTGSSVLASSVAMDKYLTKEIAARLGLATAPDHFWDGHRDGFEALQGKIDESATWVVKPSREGSTIGMAKVQGREQLEAALRQASQFDSQVLIEQFIAGREVTVAILGEELFPIVEIAPKHGFFDFAAKYQSNETEYHCPADLPEALAARLRQDLRRLYQRLGCEGVARADFIIDAAGTPYFLEINTLPGMTATSLVPKAAKAAGVSFDQLVEKILLTARLKNRED